MKKICVAVLLVSISGLFACKKSTQRKSEYPIVYLNHCFNKIYGNDQIEFCFNSVLSDSRCPTNAVCILEGQAIANFTFIKNKEEHQLTLATNTLNAPHAKDTIVAGYKIEFLDLHPYPVLGQNPPPASETRAEVKITKL